MTKILYVNIWNNANNDTENEEIHVRVRKFIFSAFRRGSLPEAWCINFICRVRNFHFSLNKTLVSKGVLRVERLSVIY